MPQPRWRFLRSHLLFQAVFGGAIAAMLAFGIIGIGRDGSSGFDMAFLYAAGRTWMSGLDAYVYVQRQASIGSFPYDIYAVAYPPQVFPLAVALGVFSFQYAKLAMFVINLASVAALALFCVHMAEPNAESTRRGSGRAYRWVIPAIVIGNPFTAHVLWMGQTSLLVAASITWGCYFALQNRWLLAGILLGVSTIKPQFSVFALIWLASQRHGRSIVATGAFSLLFALGPLLISGPVTTIRAWLADIKVYQSYPSNTVGFEHTFGTQSVLYWLGLDVPSIALVVLAVLAVIYFSRANILQRDVLPLCLATALLMGVAHDYDLIVAVPLLPALWWHLRDETPSHSAAAIFAMLVMFLPQRALKALNSPLLLQFRVFVLAALLAWLWVLSVRGARRSMVQSETTASRAHG